MVIRSAICWESETRKENAKGEEKETKRRGEIERRKGWRYIPRMILECDTERTDGKSWLPIASRRVDSERIQFEHRRLMNTRELRSWHMSTVATVAGTHRREFFAKRLATKGKYLRNFSKHHDDDSIIVCHCRKGDVGIIDVSAIHLIYLAAPQTFSC